MTALIFATDIPMPAGRLPNLARLIPFVVNTTDEALAAAARLFKAGAVVWRIEDSSGGLEESRSIVAACQQRGLLPYAFRYR
jgi:hypothetical protein